MISMTPLALKLINTTMANANQDIGVEQLRDEVGRPTHVVPQVRKLNNALLGVCNFSPWSIERNDRGNINRNGEVLKSVGLHTVHPGVSEEQKRSFLGVELHPVSRPTIPDGRLIDMTQRLEDWKKTLQESGDKRIAENLQNADLLSAFLAEQIIKAGTRGGISLPELIERATATGVFRDIDSRDVINSLRHTVTPSLNPVSNFSDRSRKNRLVVVKPRDKRNPARFVWKPKQITGSATEFVRTEDSIKY